MKNIVEIDNLVKRYGDLIALDHLKLNIREGEIFGLLGPNGSGKTTTINCILSLLKYDKGNITIFGKDMSPDSTDIKKDIGVVFQNVAVFDALTVKENIDYFCGLYIKDKTKRKQYVEEAIDFVELNEYRKMRPKQLSGGLLRRLNIACGIAHKPKLIILDEPTVAVDPQSRNKILEGIKTLNKNGATIIYTSHYMEEVELICSRIAIIDRGVKIAEGTNEELKNLIKTGEKITVENVNVTAEQINKLKKVAYVYEVDLTADILKVSFSKADNNGANIINLINFLQENTIIYCNIYSVAPTLNDVFLEITGKEIRD